MLKKIIVLGLFCCLIAASPLDAANISFIIIETGLTRENLPSDHSALWENTIFDVLFESGHIVSNASTLRLFHTPDPGFPYEVERDFLEALEGGMDFFIVAIVDHPAPFNVSLRLFRTNSEQMLYEHTYNDRVYRTEREKRQSIRENISIVASRIR